MTEKFVEVTVQAGTSPSIGAAICLTKKDSPIPLRLIMVVSSETAYYIHSVLENIPLPRPATHDLMLTILEKHNLKIKEAKVTVLVGDTFHGLIACQTGEGEVEYFDCRPSDAVALAVKSGAPIYVNEELLQEMPEE